MPVETEIQEEIQKEPVIDPPEESVPAGPTAEQVEKTNEILKEVSERLKEKPAEGPTQDKVREIIKAQTGLSDAGIDWVMKFNREMVNGAVAPLAEKVAWSELRAAKANSTFPITPEIEKEMQEELKNYPAQNRGDPVLLEKVHRLAVGTLQMKAPKEAPKRADTNPVIGRRIVTNNPAPASGAGTGGAAPKGPVLTDEEKTVARKMGVSEADYAKHKGNPAITGATAVK